MHTYKKKFIIWSGSTTQTNCSLPLVANDGVTWESMNFHVEKRNIFHTMTKGKNDQSWNSMISHEMPWSIVVSENCFQCKWVTHRCLNWSCCLFKVQGSPFKRYQDFCTGRCRNFHSISLGPIPVVGILLKRWLLSFKATRGVWMAISPLQYCVDLA